MFFVSFSIKFNRYPYRLRGTGGRRRDAAPQFPLDPVMGCKGRPQVQNQRTPHPGQKLEIKIITPHYLSLSLAEITHLLGDGPLLWPGGAGRSQGVKFVPYELKKKRGRKPKTQKTEREPLPGPGPKNLP